MHTKSLSRPFLSISAAVALFGGLVTLAAGGMARTVADLATSQGALVTSLQEESLHAAASAGAGITIVIGMFLILTGLALHALLLLHKDMERNVPVHGVERKKTTIKRGARKHKAIEVIWVEQEIRL